jgi:hypothetical protein
MASINRVTIACARNEESDMVDISEVHRRSLGGFQLAYQQELSAYRQAELSGDYDEMARAAQAMAAYRASMRELNAMATEAVAARQPAPDSNKYGLTPTEVEIARNSFGAIKDRSGRMSDLSDDQKCELYVRNRAKLARMRQTGEYRQTTEQTG